MEAARTAGTEKIVTSEAVDLISRLLTLDPHQRTSAKKVTAFAVSIGFYVIRPVVHAL